MSQPIVQDTTQPPVICSKCGQEHRKCLAHSNRSGGGPCGRPRSKGMRVCYSHGGNAKRAKAKAAERIQAEQLAKAAVTYGVRRDVNHLEALVELLQNSAGHVVWLRERIQAEAPDALVWGVSDEVNRGSGEFPGVDRKLAAAPSVWLDLYHKERAMLLNVSKELARLELDWDAREAIRKQGAALARVVRETCRLLGHDVNDQRVVGAFRAALKSVVGSREIEGSVVDVG